MKKIIFAAAITALALTSCERSYRRVNVSTPDSEVIVYDSCEYCVCRTARRMDVITHKGNCRFCAERRRAELRTLKEEIVSELKKEICVNKD